MKNVVILTALLLMVFAAGAQERDTARTQSLDSVVITGFEQARSRQHATATVHEVQTNDADFNSKVSLVHALNTAAGVRMEERSPGSYRINIRGSSLRSPFGVRNVKVYWNDIPLTDPGGNTYFNQLAFNNFSSVQIFKGPAGSLYGAGTGGLVLVNTLDRSRPGVALEHMRGSYGLNNVFATMKIGGTDNRTVVTYAHNGQDGYRAQSAMRRDNASWSSLFRVSNKYELRAGVLFTDMFYQTPGGLTKTEFDKDPKAARPAAGAFPSAQQAKAAIYQKNILAGIEHRYKIDTHWTNTTVLYAAYAQIKNPAVRNYERRSEPHAGGRTSFAWEQKQGSTSIKLVAGGELQHGFFNTQVYSNKLGNPDTLQTNDDIDYNTYSIFAQGDVSIGDSWIITAGTSLNKTKVNFTRLNKRPVTEQSRTYRQEWAPRLVVVKTFGKTSLVGIVSKGFSPPSIAELLPSTGVISTQLEAETGWNYEAGVRQSVKMFDGRGSLWMELLGYYFKLKNALVQRRDASGADFFINAGDTRQKGIEYSAAYFQHYSASHFLDHIYVEAAYGYSHYRYGSFTKDTIVFSGKTIPSVPAHTISTIVDVRSNKGLYCYASYYYASKIFLNDANTAAAAGYHLLGLRLGWTWAIKNSMLLSFYTGADNLLDEVYSLGNDINDPRGRYYNTAARRNYYAGIMFQYNKK